jgi:hypothetical protein
MSDLVNVDNRADSEAISKNIRGLSDKIDENFNKAANLFLNGDPSEWAGKDADSYKQKLQDLKVKVTSSIEDVKNLSSQIERTSSQIHEQDTQNEGTAKNL